MAANPSKLIRGGASDWEAALSRPHPRCATCERELAPGDAFVGLLVFGEDGLERRDVCPTHLDDQPALAEGAYARWLSRIPLPDEGKPRPLDVAFLADFFRRLQNDADEERREVAYIVALLLVRKKILKQVETRTVDGAEHLVLAFAKDDDDTVYDVRVPELTEDKMAAIRGDLGRIFNI